MAFDNETRNRLKSFVGSARNLLAEEFTRQLQNTYGMNPATGEIDDVSRLTHLDPSSREIAQLLRTTVEHYRATSPATTTADLLDRVVREQAFTVLNRLCALRLAEARGILIESIARGYQSKGFQLYARVANGALGDTAETYRAYLLSVFDELAVDLPVLFYRYSPQGRLFPRETALLALLELINHDDLAPFWAEDETIGWIYQYFNSVEERKKMRDESSAPRNSREMAVRNQFFTPRYVVEFLTDNTLGRTWYEMRKGQTSIPDQCRYFVRRPNEIFLAEGQEPPADTEDTSNLSQEELWKRPVYTLHRDQKDPRDLKVLDPAMGSGHFLLYAFDLLETIYREAWEQAITTPSDVTGRTLREDYPDEAALRRATPELILRHNLHGVDIDARAVQIAGLALWLRAQKAWQTAGVKPTERPAIRKSNLVVAEPMPGEQDLLDDFLKDLKPALLGRLVRQVFDSMKLAGEAGTLLRVEDELQQEIEKARREWQALQKRAKAGERSASVVDMFSGESPQQLEIELREQELMQISSERFWKDTEERVLKLLREYAEQAESGTGARRRLFADDAAKGFAFVDLCRTKFDVVLMNPPFGDIVKSYRGNLKTEFGDAYNDVYACFVERSLQQIRPRGLLGAITSRTAFFMNSLKDWRSRILGQVSRASLFVDLGEQIMDDAVVEAAAYVLSRSFPRQSPEISCFRLLLSQDRGEALREEVRALAAGESSTRRFLTDGNAISLLPESPFVYWLDREILQTLAALPATEPNIADIRKGLRTGDNFRFLRAIWEVPCAGITTWGERRGDERNVDLCWVPLCLGGDAQAWFSPTTVLINWRRDGRELRAFVEKYGTASRLIQAEDYYFKPGISWVLRSTRFIPYAVPEGSIPTGSRPMAYPKNGQESFFIFVAASNVASSFLRFYGEKFLWPKFLEGKLKLLPMPDQESLGSTEFHRIVSENSHQSRLRYRIVEPMQDFLMFTDRFDPCLVASVTSMESILGEDLDRKVEAAYGFTPNQGKKLNMDLLEALRARGASSCQEAAEDDSESDGNLCWTESDWYSCSSMYQFGLALGRWDVRYATGEKEPPPLPDPFDPLPICPPGMLQRPDGLPVEKPEELPEGYPIDIPWDGILVDDPGHGRDIVARLKRVFEVIWGEAADDRMREAAELLGQKDGDLRPWLRKDFFPFHLKRYSKSRRKAPIYWPLSTPSGAYTLWIYYHRLTDQTLLTAVNDFVEPKIDQVEGDIAKLRQNTDRTKKQEQELAALTDLEHELRDFREELLRIANFWKPNLNDGVQITAAPLWKLFQHKPWQKILKETWHALEKGDYDWAHLAYSIWPDRVREKCKTDKSLAIAHGLEDVYIEPPESKKKSKGRKKKVEVEAEIDEEGDE